MAEIRQTYTINASINDVWAALTDPSVINQWGGGPAKMSGEEGFQFELWGGDIAGENLTVEKPFQLVQQWGYGDWPNPSVVTFDLKEVDGETEVTLKQVDHPTAEHKKLEQGWHDYYLGALKNYMERG